MLRQTKKTPRTCPQGHPQEPSWETCPLCTAETLPQTSGPENGSGAAIPAPPTSDPGRGAVVVPKKRTPAPKGVLSGWFVAIGGDQEGEDFRIHTGKNVLGKGNQSNIVIKDAYVSERHAMFESMSDTCTITDLESKHGTFVNGERIEGPHGVVDGDRITLGHTELKYRSFE